MPSLFSYYSIFSFYFLDYVRSEKDIGFRVVCFKLQPKQDTRNSIDLTMMFLFVLLYIFVNTFSCRSGAQHASSSTFKD